MFRRRDVLFLALVVLLAALIVAQMGVCYSLYSDARHEDIPGSCLVVMAGK